MRLSRQSILARNDQAPLRAVGIVVLVSCSVVAATHVIALAHETLGTPNSPLAFGSKFVALWLISTAILWESSFRLTFHEVVGRYVPHLLIAALGVSFVRLSSAPAETARWLLSALIVAGAFVEEVVFRDRLPKRLGSALPCAWSRSSSAAVSVLVSQFAFAVAHASALAWSPYAIARMATLLAIGVGLFVAARFGGLWLSIFIHASANEFLTRQP